MIFHRASLKRSPRTRARKNITSTSADMDIVCPLSDSSILARRKTRPPPLQIIPELSENERDVNATHSPVTARPTQCVPRQPELVSSRITLSAYTFSIDDTLLIFGGDAPRSPALSASSSTSDCASSEGVPTTPGTSDDEDLYNSMFPTPRLCPKHISIRPLCINKTRSLICEEDEDIHNYFEREEEKSTPFVVPEEKPEHPTEAMAVANAAAEAEQDFYTREFEDFISLSPAIPSPTSPARRDSLILVAEPLPTVEVPEPKPRGRSRHSKPLPLLPPATPPVSSLPSIPTFPLVQTTAQKSVVRRKRNIPSLSNCLPPPPPVESRPPPRTAVPMDIEDSVFSEEIFHISSRGSIVTEQVYNGEEDASIYSQPSFTCTVSATTRPLPPAIQETPLSGMSGEVALPRSSTDSDAPRSSISSTSSLASSSSSNIPILPFSFLDLPSSEDHEPEPTQRLCSRWSSSTLASLPAEPTRMAILSPLRNVFGSRVRRVAQQVSPPHLAQPKPPKNRYGVSTTPSPPTTPGKHNRRQRSQSSASSTGTISSECDSHDGSPSGQKRKPIPLSMFLRGT